MIFEAISCEEEGA